MKQYMSCILDPYYFKNDVFNKYQLTFRVIERQTGWIELAFQHFHEVIKNFS